MHFYMVIFRRRYIWFNHLVMNFLGSLQVHIDSRRLDIAWSNLLKHDLMYSVAWLRNWFKEKCFYHSIFIRRSLCWSTLTWLRNWYQILIFYVEITLTGDYSQGIINLKFYLSSHFHMEDINTLQYFLRIAVHERGYLCLKESTLLTFLKNLIYFESKLSIF